MFNRIDKKPVVWTIAGSDSGGGAGIQADLLTLHDFAVHGCSVITAVTAQNTVDLQHSRPLDKASVQAQINALDNDIQADVIKLGMLADKDVVQVVADYLSHYRGCVIVDPVMTASVGGSLLSEAALALLKDCLLPRVDLLTPNIPEAQVLTGMTIDTDSDVVDAANRLLAMGVKSVLLTAGHGALRNNQRVDYWTDGSKAFWLAGEDIPGADSHGSGCTLSAAIAAMIAKGYDMADALVVAKAYVTQGIRGAVKIGQGSGAVAHLGWPAALQDLPTLSATLPLPEFVFNDCGGQLGLYPVVDSVDWIRRLVTLGVPTIQLRMKNVSRDTAREHITEAIALCTANNVRLFVNDYWQLAIELGAYGVHLGQEDLDDADLAAISRAGLRLGVSTHSYYEIARAHGIKPSYIALGPVYPTTTKVMKFADLGVEQLQQWVDLLSLHYPLTAIGGINIERAKDVIATGVGSCAMVTAITEAQDYTAAVAQLMKTVSAT